MLHSTSNSHLAVEKFCTVRKILIACFILAVVTLSVYIQVEDHPFFSYDETDCVTGNHHLESGITPTNIVWAFTSVEAYNWHPITWLSHMAVYQFFGAEHRAHHLTNVVIHTISSVLLFLLFLRLTGAFWQSLFVAAMFALHPMHVESVAWVAERKDVLSALFLFITLSAGVKVVVASAEIMQHQEVSFPPLIQGSDKPSPRASNSWYFWTSDSGS